MDEAKNRVSTQKTFLILGVFLLIIIIFQLTRMGLIENSETTVHKAAPSYPVTANGSVSTNTHNLGKIALIYDETATDRRYVYDNFVSLLKKYSLNFDTFKATDDADETGFTGYELVIPIIGDFADSPLLQEVFDFVDNGGSAYFPIVPSDSDSFISVSGSLGVVEKSYQNSCNEITDIKGILGAANKTYTFFSPLPLRYHVRLRSDCDVYFKEGNNPLFWKRQLNRGTVYVSNCDYLSSYFSRGVVSQILYETLKKDEGKSLIYPLYNTSTQLLEEFPSSSLIKTSKITAGLGVNYETFIDSYYWPFLNELYMSYHVKPTICYVMSYSEDVSGNFQVSLLPNVLKLYSTEALRSGGEVAFHGYSMRPLGLAGQLKDEGWFVPWKSYDVMKESFNVAKNSFSEHFPNYKITTYFPPQGRIAPEVIERLGNLDKDIKVIVAPYNRLYPDQLTNDFTSDKYGFFYYSTTSDYDGMVWNTANSLQSLGLSSTSFDVNQMLLDNRVTFDAYKKSIEASYKMVSGFPGMENMTVSDASKKISVCNNAKYSYRETENGITLKVNGWFDGISFAIRSDKNLRSGDGYTIEKYKEGFYVVFPQRSEVTIR